MITGFNPSVSNNRNRVQKQKFGSFPVPKDHYESGRLYEKAVAKDLLPTPDNIDSLKMALKEGKKTVQFGLEDLARLWGKDPNELRK